MENLIIDVGLVIIVATFLGYIAHMIKQPLIPMYILAGFILGPLFGWITETKTILLLSEIGIAFLLFIVGLEIDLKKLQHVAFVSSFGGVIQIVSVFSIGYFGALALGMLTLEAAYVGIIIALSSTMIVLKLLSDRKEIDTLHGRIVIGILLVQDVFAIIALAILASYDGFNPGSIVFSLLSGLLMIIFAGFTSKYLFPSIFKVAAKSQEMLFLVSITVCFVFALAFNMIGFSLAVGAFIAGVALANLPYNVEIVSKVKSLRDFFAILFFVSLGLQIMKSGLNGLTPIFIFIIVGVVLIKPFLIMIICSIFGYHKQPSFLTAISLAQISEFSLIIVNQGYNLGHISSEMFSMTIIATIITLITTSYTLRYEKIVFGWLSKYMSFMDILIINNKHLEYRPKKQKKYEIILIGADRIGFSIIKGLDKFKNKTFVIDYNPEVIKNLIERRIHCMYGDISDLEVIDRINLKKVKLFITTIPDVHDNLLILKKVKHAKKNIIVFLTANTPDDALILYNNGADYVILPHFLGGEQASILIRNFHETVDFSKLIAHKVKHLKELKMRCVTNR